MEGCPFCETFTKELEKAIDTINILMEENKELKKRIFRMILKEKNGSNSGGISS